MADQLEYYEDYPENRRRFSLPREMAEPAPAYTYADYLSWDIGPEVRMELHDGMIYMMSAPNVAHQAVFANLLTEFVVFFKDKKCRVLPDVDTRPHPRADNKDTTVVRPDITITCDGKKIGEKGINGAPNLVVEILSPSTRKNDLGYKLELYEEAGVGEYWIVDPKDKTIAQYILTDSGYTLAVFKEGAVPVGLTQGKLEIELIAIFG
jgi:Uma2 family endonuclease